MPLCWLLVAAVALGAVGCHSNDETNRDAPGGPFYEMLDGTGTRALLLDASDEPHIKIRVRSSGYKIYGSDLSPVGHVTWPPEGTDEDRSRPAIEIRRFDGGTEQLDRLEGGGFQWPEHLRLEETARGWAVFDAEGEWIARFRRVDSEAESGARWRLESTSDGTTSWSVDRSGRRPVLRRNGEVIYRLSTGDLPDSLLIATAIDELTPLERGVVGTLLSRLETATSSSSNQRDEESSRGARDSGIDGR